MLISMRYGNASEMALVSVTFECMSYQALNLYHINYFELYILVRYYSPKFSVGLLIFYYLFFLCVAYDF